MAVPLLVALAALMALPSVLSYDAGLDEAFVYALTQHGLGGLFDQWTNDPQALVPQLAAYPFGATGHSVWWLRIPALMAFCAAVVCMWWVARQRYSSRVALGAAVLLAVAPTAVTAGSDARWVAMALLIGLVSWGALFRALDGGGWRWWAVYGGAVAVGAYCNALVVLLVAAHLIPVLWAGRRAVRGWIISLIGTGLALAPMALLLRAASGTTNPLVRINAPDLQAIPGFFARLLGGGSPGAVRQGLVLVVVLLVAGAIWSLRGQLRSAAVRPGLLAIAWVAIPVAVAFVISVVGNSVWEARYVVGVLPGIFILVAWSAERLGRVGIAGFLVVAALMSGASLSNGLRATGEERSKDWSALVVKERPPGAPVVFYEAEGVQGAGFYEPALAAADGSPIVPDWDTTPVPSDIVLLDNPAFDRLPDGPPDVALVKRLLGRTGSLMLVIRPPDPEPPGIAWARARCAVTRNDIPYVAVVRITECRSLG